MTPELEDQGKTGIPKPAFAREAEKYIPGSRYEEVRGGILSYKHPVSGNISYLYGNELIARVARQNKIMANEWVNREREIEAQEKNAAADRAAIERARTQAFFKGEKQEDKARKKAEQREGRIGQPLYEAFGEGAAAVGGGTRQLIDEAGNIIEQGLDVVEGTKDKFLDSLLGGL
jgi:hypothetical protein